MHISAFRTKKPNHVFVDTVRFWSMFAVIGYHCLIIFAALRKPLPETSLILATALKFGTIGFFLISGFLMGDRVQACRPLEYMGKRMKKVFVPWMCWFLTMCLYLFMNHRHEFAWTAASARLMKVLLYCSLFETPYWFVPNLLLGLSLLLVFRKYLYDLRLGAVLLAIDLFYSVNIYGRWIPSSHQEALLGFVFYLWLGSYAARRFDELSLWIAKIPTWTWIALTIAAACCALGEAEFLAHLGSKDALNTLRVTNQIFSILTVLTLVKLGGAAQPRFVDSRRVTFGLYLLHPLVIDLVLRYALAGSRQVPADIVWQTPGALVFVWVLVFAAVYVGSLGLTSLLGAWQATAWLVGADAVQGRPAISVAVAADSRTRPR
jgi:membrane-bound acyltransferase YfiQ involved in biofilm formation